MKPSRSPARQSTEASGPLQASQDGDLQRLVERAGRLAELDALLQDGLPAALAGQVRLANVRGQTLVFIASSPVWKAGLRLHAESLLARAAAAGLAVRALAIKISALPDAPSAHASAHRPLSEAVRAQLQAVASSVSDPALRAQLLRLASLPPPRGEGA